MASSPTPKSPEATGKGLFEGLSMASSSRETSKEEATPKVDNTQRTMVDLSAAEPLPTENGVSTENAVGLVPAVENIPAPPLASDDIASEEHHHPPTTPTPSDAPLRAASVTEKFLGMFNSEPVADVPPQVAQPVVPSSAADADAADATKAAATETAEEKSAPPTAAEEEGSSKPAATTDNTTKTTAVQEDQSATANATPTQEDTPAPTPTTPSTPRRAGGMRVHSDTPIPNADKCLRLLRKFASKTRPKISHHFGGTKGGGIMKFFRKEKEDPTFVPYRKLMEALLSDGDDVQEEEEESSDEEDDNDGSGANHVVDSILGVSGDTMAKAKTTVAAFCHVLTIWGHASSRFFEQQDRKSQQAFSELLVAGLDSAAELVSHGCLDGVQICLVDDPGEEYHCAINMLAESVLVADVTLERSELAAMKFLLCAGCRVKPGDEALLRGTHLLQTIRMLYHIYLTTESKSNRTTARAALQQMVTGIFARLVRTQVAIPHSYPHQQQQEVNNSNSGEGSPPKKPTNGNSNPANNFPSENHRDAYLVLRSICKLSMRNLPGDPNMHSHIGLATSGSHAMWNGDQEASDRGADDSPVIVEAPRRPAEEQAHLVYTSAIHPAMESKILALELLHYILENVKFTREFVNKSGVQFHSAIRNYLCVSLLKNCTSDNTRVVNLSLRMFALLVRNFRTILKNEVEAFVTNVFFVILDSKNSPIEHKSLVVTLFEEICSDPHTLAEIFLNYDCDLSAVDLFHRIVNTLARVARSDPQEPKSTSTLGFVAGAGAARAEKMRNDHRELRLDAMRALRQVLASLHASIVEPMNKTSEGPIPNGGNIPDEISSTASIGGESVDSTAAGASPAKSPAGESSKQSLVQIYDSKKKRRQEEAEAILRFNQKPAAGIKYAAECGHLAADDPADIARYLLQYKDSFEKTQIGEYLGREAEYQGGIALKVLHEYVRLMDFAGLQFDDAIRYYLSGFRLPGEAQKIDRIMEKFAERYVEQNPDIFPTADVAFILAFSIIMLNTDLHNPAIKEDRRMTRDGFIRNNRGICDGQDLPDEFLLGIFDRIKLNPISLKEDDEAREKVGDSGKGGVGSLPAALSPATFFSSHYDDMDRTRETNFQKERDHIVRTTESLLRRRRHSAHTPEKKSTASSKAGTHGTRRAHSKFVRTEDSGLRDEYVSPMFDVTWGPALAAFSTAMESANGTLGALENIATDDELERAAENAAETIEVCLTGFKFAICTAGLCGNDTARDAFMHALSRFSQLGTGVLLEPRHVRCIQTVLSLAKDDGELLGPTWEHVFKALAEVNRFHQLFHLMARNDRNVAAAAERRRKRLEERERRHNDREARLKESASGDESSVDDLDSSSTGSVYSDSDASFDDADLFSDDEDFMLDDELDGKAIDEANARMVYEAVSESLIDAIYQRSSSLSTPGIKEFIFQLCRVSRMEISVGGYGGHAANKANQVDLTQVQYRQHHTLLNNIEKPSDQQKPAFHHGQPNIYSLQKLVEVTHYNMDSRPRLVFAEIWTTVSGHLTSTALHSNPAVAMYAVDSFRQLSIQFLQRGETEGFEVQRRFLKPLETVISRSDQVSTKELLLKCVERIVFMYGCEEPSGGSGRKGFLRSGWVTILRIIAIAGGDEDEGVAQMGYEMFKEQLKNSVEIEHQGSIVENPQASSILAEHFVDAVDALFTYVGGAHENLGVDAIDQLISLCDYLADKSTPLPPLRRKTSHLSMSGDEEPANGVSNKGSASKDFEHWWPILLGLSKSVGHYSIAVRSKALSALLKITDHHFFSEDNGSHDEKIQTLRLIYRGILTPVLEFAEMSPTTKPPTTPEDFKRIVTKAEETEDEDVADPGWLESSFEDFMDGCISICLHSIEALGDDTLVEEIFAILNNCLLSDSGALAVRGLKRLEQFVTADLDQKYVTDDTWATVSHMLRRSLTVRGLPKSIEKESSAEGEKPSTPEKASMGDGQPEDAENEDEEIIREFVLEDRLLPDRRFVGSNTVMVIGSLLTDERFTDAITMRWRTFLVSGLGKGIRDWEQAASVIRSYGSKQQPNSILPPDYLENAMYARSWMVRLLLQLVSMEEVAVTPEGSDPAASRVAAYQTIVKEQTQKLLASFLSREGTALKKGSSLTDQELYKITKTLVMDFLSGLDSMDPDFLRHLEWLNTTLLTWCLQSKDQGIQKAVHDLLEKTSPASRERPPDSRSDEDDDAPEQESEGDAPEQESAPEQEPEKPEESDD